jgi:hypothetical protein
MLRLLFFYKIILMLDSKLLGLLSACTRIIGGQPATQSPRGLQYNQRPNMLITDCYENLKSAILIQIGLVTTSIFLNSKTYDINP